MNDNINYSFSYKTTRFFTLVQYLIPIHKQIYKLNIGSIWCRLTEYYRKCVLQFYSIECKND